MTNGYNAKPTVLKVRPNMIVMSLLLERIVRGAVNEHAQAWHGRPVEEIDLNSHIARGAVLRQIGQPPVSREQSFDKVVLETRFGVEVPQQAAVLILVAFL